ncbi:hypothetical protein CSC94_08950 [Zhengella mangrovi]|uniref:TVP38/TMEM64 family membrane protein n=1 Tax=Zhengella mangrovi TaxID=1982044 RepID=A0A2G1QQR3_9HYPH|nr:hypothetical protein [Zhengella mangrovi]PHP67794.1 hypothetical protein CSC94_08950 [Zhengella mangrovi]
MQVSEKLQFYIGIGSKIALFIVVLIAAKLSGDWVMAKISGELTPRTEPMLHRFIMAAIGIYICLMTLPFVPGAEIGLGLIAMLGPRIAPLVYGCTVIALVLAFMIGRLIPQDAIIRGFEQLHLKRAASLLRDVKDLDFEERTQFLVANSTSRILPVILRYRFVALMIALNIPGNSAIGGGGGIGIMAGYSRMFKFPTFLAAVAIAVAPVPLFLFLTG